MYVLMKLKRVGEIAKQVSDQAMPLFPLTIVQTAFHVETTLEGYFTVCF